MFRGHSPPTGSPARNLPRSGGAPPLASAPGGRHGGGVVGGASSTSAGEVRARARGRRASRLLDPRAAVTSRHSRCRIVMRHFVISAGACKHWVARALQVGERAVTAPSARDQAAAVCERVGAPPARDQAAARRQRGARRAVTDAWFQVVEAVAKKHPSVCLMARLIIRHLIAPPAARGYLPGALRIFILFLPFVSSILIYVG